MLLKGNSKNVKFCSTTFGKIGFLTYRTNLASFDRLHEYFFVGVPQIACRACAQRRSAQQQTDKRLMRPPKILLYRTRAFTRACVPPSKRWRREKNANVCCLTVDRELEGLFLLFGSVDEELTGVSTCLTSVYAG
jgi:hypothetical protein